MTEVRANENGAARRSLSNIARGTIRSVKDSPKGQELEINLLHDEVKRGVEHWHSYGFYSVPLAGAEVLTAFLGGSRSHAVVTGVLDRRYRPRNKQAGEVGLHDDQGQGIHLTRSGIVIDGNDKTVTIKVGDAEVKVNTDGSISAKPAAGKFVFLGGTGSDGAYDFVVTLAGPSSNVKAKL